LLHLRDLSQTEVGGFGVSRPGDLLLVEDVHLVQQRCSPVSVHFEDQAVADYFDEQVDRGRRPPEFARIWIHTHPGDSPDPSPTDEATFSRCFGAADWAVMFIVARGGRAYARLKISAGPRGELLLPVEIDYRQAFAATDANAWTAEYLQKVRAALPRPLAPPRPRDDDLPPGLDGEWPSWGDIWFEAFPPASYPDPPLELLDGRF